MSRHLLLSIVIVASSCVGCSHSVWTSSREIVPTTYSVSDVSIKRNVGRLRRLALMPVSFRLEGGGSVDPIDESHEPRLREDISNVARRFLVDWRGYEVVVVDDCDSDQVAVLLEWASTSENDAAPPEPVRQAIADLGRRHHVDGVVLIQGRLKILSDLGLAIICATGSLAWPVVLPADSGANLRIDMFESGSGRIVWRSQAEDWIGDPSDRNVSLQVERLLHPLEHAVPRVMVEDAGERR